MNINTILFIVIAWLTLGALALALVALGKSRDQNENEWEWTPEALASMKDARAEYDSQPRKTFVDEDAPCEHVEHDHGICLDCGEDINDDLIARAEYMSDSREDR